MGAQQKAKFVGHGTGIVINELPILGARSKDIMAEGMTIALEPKFVIPGTGAVGVEDTLLVTANGMENLTPAPSDIITL
jgi:Xaa-Pro aminopeptidase